ncbi:SPOR domain-containing protein [Litchfieldella rifensis]|uniref:SPOR domain-containing protein n=1 Tax=Litchfieldella rifensis TaxID=762643 RepID=A0ABV7LPD7_9GAMM
MAARPSRQGNSRPAKRSGATSRRRAPGKARSGIPGWLWGVAGLVAGFFLAQYVQESAPTPLATVLPKPSSSASPDASSSRDGNTGKTSSESRMPTFEFYTLLPESEVIAPRSEATTPRPQAPTAERPEPETANDPIAAQLASIDEAVERSMASPEEKRQAPQPTAASSRYMLQAASFRESGDAQRLAGRLRDFGLMAKISEVQTGGGDTWHRVQVGPYDDRRELNRAQDLMVTQGIEPLLIRLQQN